jgi:uncharacterized protein (DUF302 family)
VSKRTEHGMVHLSSQHTVEETIARLRSILDQRGIHVHACIDHSGDAESNGLKMLPAKLLIFGNPKAGTPLMIAAPTVAIDLPLKALAWQDADAKVWLSYNVPEYICERHGVPPGLVMNISGVGALCEEAVS